MKNLIFFLFALMGVQTLNAQEAYAVLTETDSTLTFYYDDNKSTYTEKTFVLNSEGQEPQWVSDSTKIKKVVFDESFASARPKATNHWFFNLHKLTSITGIQYLNTDEVVTMLSMFYGCRELTSLDLSNFNTEKVYNMNYMFYGCSSLSDLNISGFNTTNVTKISNMFYGCSSLTSLDVSCFNTAKANNMDYMFYGCSSLKSLDLSNFNTENVYSMSYMFYGCNSLASLDLSNFNTEKVYTMRYMFYDCSSLTTLDVSHFNTSNVNYIDHMFFNCKSLAELDLSNFNTEKVYDMSYMFYGCSSMTDLDVSNFNTSKVSSMAGMFQACTGLTTLDLSNFNTANVSGMYAMFWYSTGLKTIYVGSEWTTGSVTYSKQMFYGCENLVGEKGTVYDESHIDAEYARIDKGANGPGYFSSKVYAVINDDTMSFYCDTCRYSREGTMYSLDITEDSPEWYWDNNIKNITTVRFDSTFADVRPKSTSMWFEDMKNLTTIIGMEYLNTSEVTNISYMFAECRALTSIDLSHFNTSKVTNMASLFKNCSSLTSIDLSSFDTKNVTDVSMLFFRCSSLTSVDISNFNTVNVKKMSNMFNGCSSLTSIDMNKFNTSNVTSMLYMFSACSNLTTIYVGNEWSTEKVENSTNMFLDCPNLIGGKGTVYDESHVDAEYAHIDGGDSNPGYFTYKTPYDLNNDGKVSTADIQVIINEMKKPQPSQSMGYDLNGDGKISTADIQVVINEMKK